jgi:PHD/YefM family antitoxin component YafN of YafNO toxin-antitoxin module
MSVVSIPLTATGPSGVLPDAVGQVVEHDDVRVLLTRDGEPVAAIVPVDLLRALEEMDHAEEAYWERLADEAAARWEADGRPPGISHEEMLERYGITPDAE